MQSGTKYSATASLAKTSGLAIAAAVALLAGQASAAVLVNDSFSDNERSTQSLPNSLQWFGANSVTTLDASAGNLVVPQFTTSPGSAALAHFTSSGSPLTMGVGDSLKLSFTITTPATLALATDNTFFFGFLDSGGTRPSVDGGFNGSQYNNDTGYWAIAPLVGAHTGRNKIVRRDPGANNLTTSANFVQLGATAATPNLTAGGTYTYSLEMVLTSASEMTLMSDMGGVQLSRSDTSASVRTSFDSVFLFTQYNPAVTIDNVVIDYTAVPEPAAAGLLALVSGAAMLRRRRA